MGNLTNTSVGYNFYIWGMTSAAAGASITVTDPNLNKWKLDLSGESDGYAFNLPNPLSTTDPLSQPYGWTISDTSTPYTFVVEISSTATGDNEALVLTAANDSVDSVMQVFQYNDPSNVDEDYNDVVLNIAFFPNEPHGINS